MSAVRRATVEDVPRLVELAQVRYPAHDLSGASSWASGLITSPHGAIFTCGDSVVTVGWQYEFWRPNDRVADVLPMYGSASNPWDTINALKAAVEWAKNQSCYAIRFGSTDGAMSHQDRGFDLFAPFAKRLRAKLFGVTYIIDLKGN